MPLESGPPGSAEFKHNVETEMAAGKPQKQAVAIAYSKSGERHDMLEIDSAKLDALLTACDALGARMDALEKERL
jgi:hypothetical protein